MINRVWVSPNGQVTIQYLTRDMLELARRLTTARSGASPHTPHGDGPTPGTPTNGDLIE